MPIEQRQQECASGPENLPSLGEKFVALREKPCGGELFENRRAHVDRRAQRGDGGDGGALGADPADPQAAPERLRHRADRQHQVASRRHRGGHRLRYRFVQPHVEDGFVDDGAGPGLGDDARQPLSVAVQASSARWDSGCPGSGRPGSATAVAPRPAMRRAPSRPRSSRRERAGPLRWRWTSARRDMWAVPPGHGRRAAHTWSE